jgi:parvulin-like peptidyl-prolyl isomerase
MNMTIKEDQIRDQLIEQVIDHYLVTEYGNEKGIALSEKELQKAISDIRKEYTEDTFKDILLRGYVDFDQWKNRLKDRLLYNKIIENVTENIVPPTYQEIKRYYETNQDKFRSPQMLKFRQIVIRSKEEADNLLIQLHKGKEMSELARQYSITPEAEKGGIVGWIARDHLEESMGKTLFSMPTGKISPVIRTPYGYHIFEVLSVRPEGVKEIPEVISEIKLKLLNQKRTAFYDKWLKELRTHFVVKVNQNLLKTLELS